MVLENLDVLGGVFHYNYYESLLKSAAEGNLCLWLLLIIYHVKDVLKALFWWLFFCLFCTLGILGSNSPSCWRNLTRMSENLAGDLTRAWKMSYSSLRSIWHRSYSLTCLSLKLIKRHLVGGWTRNNGLDSDLGSLSLVLFHLFCLRGIMPYISQVHFTECKDLMFANYSHFEPD